MPEVDPGARTTAPEPQSGFEWSEALSRLLLIEDAVSGRRVLEVGVSDLSTLDRLVRAGARRVAATSPHPERFELEQLRGRRIELIAMDRGRLDFEDNAFDVAIVADVVHQLSGGSGFLDELRRVLAPDGFAMLAFESAGRALVDLVGERRAPVARDPVALTELIRRSFPETLFVEQTPFVGIALMSEGIDPADAGVSLDATLAGPDPEPSHVIALVGARLPAVEDRTLVELPFRSLQAMARTRDEGAQSELLTLRASLDETRQELERRKVFLRQLGGRLKPIRAALESRSHDAPAKVSLDLHAGQSLDLVGEPSVAAADHGLEAVLADKAEQIRALEVALEGANTRVEQAEVLERQHLVAAQEQERVIADLRHQFQAAERTVQGAMAERDQALRATDGSRTELAAHLERIHEQERSRSAMTAALEAERESRERAQRQLEELKHEVERAEHVRSTLRTERDHARDRADRAERTSAERQSIEIARNRLESELAAQGFTMARLSAELETAKSRFQTAEEEALRLSTEAETLRRGHEAKEADRVALVEAVRSSEEQRAHVAEEAARLERALRAALNAGTTPTVEVNRLEAALAERRAVENALVEELAVERARVQRLGRETQVALERGETQASKLEQAESRIAHFDQRIAELQAEVFERRSAEDRARAQLARVESMLFEMSTEARDAVNRASGDRSQTERLLKQQINIEEAIADAIALRCQAEAEAVAAVSNRIEIEAELKLERATTAQLVARVAELDALIQDYKSSVISARRESAGEADALAKAQADAEALESQLAAAIGTRDETAQVLSRSLVSLDSARKERDALRDALVERDAAADATVDVLNERSRALAEVRAELVWTKEALQDAKTVASFAGAEAKERALLGEQALRETQQENLALAAAAKTLEGTLVTRSLELAETRRELEQFHRADQSREASFRENERRLSAFNTRLDDAHTRAEAAESEASELRTRLEGYERSQRESERLATLVGELEARLGASETHASRLADALGSAVSDVRRLESEHSDLLEARSKWAVRLEDEQKQVQTLRDELVDSERHSARVVDALDGATRDVQRLEDEVSGQGERLEAAQNEIEALRSDARTVIPTPALPAEPEALREEHEALAEEVMRLREALRTECVARETLREQLSEREEEFQSADEGRLVVLEARAADAEAEVEALQVELRRQRDDSPPVFHSSLPEIEVPAALEAAEAQAERLNGLEREAEILRAELELAESRAKAAEDAYLELGRLSSLPMEADSHRTKGESEQLIQGLESQVRALRARAEDADNRVQRANARTQEAEEGRRSMESALRSDRLEAEQRIEAADLRCRAAETERLALTSDLETPPNADERGGSSDEALDRARAETGRKVNELKETRRALEASNAELAQVRSLSERLRAALEAQDDTEDLRSGIREREQAVAKLKVQQATSDAENQRLRKLLQDAEQAHVALEMRLSELETRLSEREHRIERLQRDSEQMSARMRRMTEH